MVTYTTTYNFAKPTVGDDEDVWGGYLNGNFDTLESLLKGTTALTSLSLTGSLSDGTTSRTVADIVGLTSSQFLRSDASDTYTGTLTLGTAASNIYGSDNKPLVQLFNGTDAYFGSNARTNTTLASSSSTGIRARINTAYYTMWHAGNDGSGSGLDADTLDGVEGSNYLRSDEDDTIDGNLTIGGTAHIAMQQGHYVNRRFEVDPASATSVVYILLCRNAGGNDVNGTITMDRTSGLRFACSWDIIVSSGSSLTPVGSLMGHSVSGNGQPDARLVTLTYSLWRATGAIYS